MRLAAAVIAAAGLAAVAASPVGATSPPTTICTPAFSGPKVTIPYQGGKKSFHMYYAGVWTYSCSTATGYVKKFIKQRSAGNDTRLSGGPSGYVCKSLAPKGYTIFQGSCKAGGKTHFHG